MGNFKQKILAGFVVAIIGAILILVFQKGLLSKPAPEENSSNSESTKQEIPTDAKPQIVSTRPDPLENAIVSGTETVEITFNRPLENVGEFKFRMEPEIEYKIELSQDRKTAKIVPVKPYQLGSGYTIFIGPETKFDGVGRWGEEKIFHFRTITYRGI